MSNDQRNLLTTGVAVVIGCVMAWILLVDRNGPQPQHRQTAVQPKVGFPIKKQAPRPEVQVQEEVVSRPLPPPTVLLPPKPAQTAVEMAKVPAAVVAQPDIAVEEEVILTTAET